MKEEENLGNNGKPPKSFEQFTEESLDLINSQLNWFLHKVEALEQNVEKLEKAEKDRQYKDIQEQKFMEETARNVERSR